MNTYLILAERPWNMIQGRPWEVIDYVVHGIGIVVLGILCILLFLGLGACVVGFIWRGCEVVTAAWRRMQHSFIMALDARARQLRSKR